MVGCSAIHLDRPTEHPSPIVYTANSVQAGRMQTSKHALSDCSLRPKIQVILIFFLKSQKHLQQGLLELNFSLITKGILYM